MSNVHKNQSILCFNIIITTIEITSLKKVAAIIFASLIIIPFTALADYGPDVSAQIADIEKEAASTHARIHRLEKAVLVISNEWLNNNT